MKLRKLAKNMIKAIGLQDTVQDVTKQEQKRIKRLKCIVRDNKETKAQLEAKIDDCNVEYYKGKSKQIQEACVEVTKLKEIQKKELAEFKKKQRDELNALSDKRKAKLEKEDVKFNAKIGYLRGQLAVASAEITKASKILRVATRTLGL